MTVSEIRDRVFSVIASGGSGGASLWEICKGVFESDDIRDCINIETDIVFSVLEELLEAGTIDKIESSVKRIYRCM